MIPKYQAKIWLFSEFFFVVLGWFPHLSPAWDLHQGDQLQAHPQGQALLEGQNQGFQGVPLKSIAKYLRCFQHFWQKRGRPIYRWYVYYVYIEIILDYIDMVWHVAMHILIRVSLHESIYYMLMWGCMNLLSLCIYIYTAIPTWPTCHVVYVCYLYLYLSICTYICI